MALADYLSLEEKRKVRELKTKMLEAISTREVKHFEKEIHNLLDIAEKRYVKYELEERVPMLTK